VIAALLLVAAVQGGLEVTARVDRARVTVGAELTLTVRARSRAPGPVEIGLPSIAGFAVTDSREASEIVHGGGEPAFATVRAVTLRAERAGQLVIGPIVARQGADRVQTEPVLVLVDSAPPPTSVTLGAAALALLEGTPLPRGQQAEVRLVLSSDRVLVGQQVDVVVAGWFPRTVRDRLRRPPQIALPAATGAWVLPQPAPQGVAVTRRGPAGWMDAFVAHQVLLPLAPGRLVIPRAVVSYALPLSFSFFSREERLTVASDSAVLTVLPLPPEPGGSALPAVVGTDVAIAVRWPAAGARVGEPFDVVARVAGAGNVPLWTEPRIEWPPGFRAYPAGVEEHIEIRNGRLAGARAFRVVVVPDSSGSFVVPEVRYRYFDVAAGRHAEAVAPPRSVAVAPASEARAMRGALALAAAAPAWTRSLTDRVPPPEWLLGALLAPVAGVLVRLRRRRRAAPGPSALPPARPVTRLGRLEREFEALLANHVPDDRARYGHALGSALRAAGLDGAVADHVVRLRDRLRAARYGPPDVGDGTAIAAELEQVLSSLGHREPGRGRARRVASFGIALAAVAAGTAPAQTLTAEQLYEAGALRAAADSFRARAAAAPHVAGHWYNLGATHYRSGADGRAVAAWATAARLAPRDILVRRARRLVPPPDPASADLLAAGPFTAVEWLVVAGGTWLATWIAVAVGTRRWPAAVLALAAATAAGGAALERRRAGRPVAVVLAPATPVRSAPHGTAAATTTLEAGAAVLAGRRYGPWVEVRRADGVHGWVLEAELERL
jgi:hypothetical protein